MRIPQIPEPAPKGEAIKKPRPNPYPSRPKPTPRPGR